MTVYVYGASIDENGKAYGGQAGNQTGRELRKQPWYKHSKGWRVFRAIDPQKAKRIAACQIAAVKNMHIGYDQWQRNTLYKEAEQYGFDVSKVTKNVECDCSALVRVSCAYAGILGLPSDFRTGNMPKNLMATGQFVELLGAKYTDQPDYLKAGDILVTATNGHTVVVGNDGPKAESTASVLPAASAAATGASAAGAASALTLTRILKRGMTGADVKAMQAELILLGYNLGGYGADGDFGAHTEAAVRQFQADHALEIDGEFGPRSLAALVVATGSEAPKPATAAQPGGTVVITGGTVNVRSAPGTASRILGMVCKGDRLPYQGQEAQVNGTPWYLVVYRGENAWVSGKYSMIE